MVAAISATLSGDSFWLFGSAEVCAWQPVSKRKVHRGNKVFIIVGISLYMPGKGGDFTVCHSDGSLLSSDVIFCGYLNFPTFTSVTRCVILTASKSR